MPTADAAKYGGSGRKQRRSCSRDVAPLKQTSLHRLMIKLTDIRNVLNVIEEMPCEHTGANRLRDSAHSRAVVNELLKDEKVPGTAPGRCSPVVGVACGQIVGLAGDTVRVAELRSAHLKRMNGEPVEWMRRLDDPLILVVGLYPISGEEAPTV
jgi:hypothetical protein